MLETQLSAHCMANHCLPSLSSLMSQIGTVKPHINFTRNCFFPLIVIIFVADTISGSEQYSLIGEHIRTALFYYSRKDICPQSFVPVTNYLSVLWPYETYRNPHALVGMLLRPVSDGDFRVLSWCAHFFLGHHFISLPATNEMTNDVAITSVPDFKGSIVLKTK